MFHPVASRVSFPEMEKSVLDWWESNRIFERSVEAREGRERFVFYEGPPTANGSPGIHHVLARVFKDIIPRYRTMKGYYTPRIAGWDTHGLPVELEIEKKLGFSGKTQIEEYGIDRFNALCRENVTTYLAEWNTMTRRIGFWVDLENPYITMDNHYIESVWWAIKQMWDGGLIYQGYRVTPHCPRCGTSLSSHEVALGYRENTRDPSIYIKFIIAKPLYQKPGFLEKLGDTYGKRAADFARWLVDLSRDKPVHLLAWTTTPWTLPGNTALAVSGDAEYSLIEYNGALLILATARLKPLGLGEVPVVAKIRGASLLALRYHPLYNPNDFDIPIESMALPDKEGESLPVSWKENGVVSYPVIGTDFASMDEGTGIVHVAPAYGEVDYQAGQENALAFVHPITLEGKIGGNYSFSGKFVKDADPLIVEELNKRGLLFHRESILHTYPFCWRCESPLLYYAKQTWYVRTTMIKEQLIEGNQQINWYPEHIKYGRFGDWLRNNIDWAFSRERYWGTPLPVWCCKSCGSCECIGGTDDLKKKPSVTGLSKSLDLHRPFVDEITFGCEQCGGQMKRTPEVIDCWFDSGAMPIAQWHYPFENETLLQDGRFPADYICEAVDQTRGWFYSLHAISTLLFGKPSFRNVICLGHILDEKGEKMSKARGNVVEPMSVINKYGADSLRWYCLTSSPPGNVRRFSEKLVSEVNRRFLLTLWNVYSFFVTYANIDHFNPNSEEIAKPPALDRWILSELNQLVSDVETSLEAYNPTDAGRKIEVFVDYLSNWYVRRSRRRFWKSENDTDKLSAYQTLYHCLVTLSKLLAPFTPFLAEELYRNLVGTYSPELPQSVHFNDFPTASIDLIDKELSEDIRLAMKLSSMGRAARSKAGIKVRQPLDINYVSLISNSQKEALQRIETSVMEELNIKNLQLMDDISRLDETHVTITDAELSIAVPTIISDELIDEGLAREVVHRLQTMRRSARFDISDHIITFYQGADDIRRVMIDFAGYICQETLSKEIIEAIPSNVAVTESYRIGKNQITLGIRRAT